ncbi:MAG: hypothetical protein R3F14_26395 [Polyangiaceae bacterium]
MRLDILNERRRRPSPRVARLLRGRGDLESPSSPRALARHAEEGLHVIPVLVATATLEATPLYGRTHLPRTGAHRLQSRQGLGLGQRARRASQALDKIPNRPPPPQRPASPPSPRACHSALPARACQSPPGSSSPASRQASSATPSWTPNAASRSWSRWSTSSLDQRLRVIAVTDNNNLATVAYKLIDWASAARAPPRLSSAAPSPSAPTTHLSAPSCKA